MDLVETRRAAEQLGVTSRRVQQLVADGSLVQPARGLIDATSLARYRAPGDVRRTRGWQAPTAWAAIALLEGRAAPWIGERQSARLRARLRTLDCATLVMLARHRAVEHVYRAHPSARGPLAASLLTLAEVEARLGLAGADQVSGYLATIDLVATVERFALKEDPTGDVVLRVVDFDWRTVRSVAAGSVVVAALDLAGSADVRERSMGLGELGRVLEGVR